MTHGPRATPPAPAPPPLAQDPLQLPAGQHKQAHRQGSKHSDANVPKQGKANPDIHRRDGKTPRSHPQPRGPVAPCLRCQHTCVRCKLGRILAAIVLWQAESCIDKYTPTRVVYAWLRRAGPAATARNLTGRSMYVCMCCMAWGRGREPFRPHLAGRGPMRPQLGMRSLQVKTP